MTPTTWPGRHLDDTRHLGRVWTSATNHARAGCAPWRCTMPWPVLHLDDAPCLDQFHTTTTYHAVAGFAPHQHTTPRSCLLPHHRHYDSDLLPHLATKTKVPHWLWLWPDHATTSMMYGKDSTQSCIRYTKSLQRRHVDKCLELMVTRISMLYYICDKGLLGFKHVDNGLELKVH